MVHTVGLQLDTDMQALSHKLQDAAPLNSSRCKWKCGMKAGCHCNLQRLYPGVPPHWKYLCVTMALGLNDELLMNVEDLQCGVVAMCFVGAFS